MLLITHLFASPVYPNKPRFSPTNDFSQFDYVTEAVYLYQVGNGLLLVNTE
jgi:hypothetical protein